MTTPNPISEILEALENNPEIEEALRQRILTRELLALPEQVAQLTATVADMARVFEQRLSALEAKQDATDARFDGRARIQHHASGATTHAAVTGASISDANRERARGSQVTVIALID